MQVTQQTFLDLLMKHIDAKGKQAKLKSPSQLQDLLEATVYELNRLDAMVEEQQGQEGSHDGSPTGSRCPVQLELSMPLGLLTVAPCTAAQIVLMMNCGRNSGLHEQCWSRVRFTAPVVDLSMVHRVEISALPRPTECILHTSEPQLRCIGGHFSGINRKAQLKPLKWSDRDPDGGIPRCTEALLILKHGGVLTHAGLAGSVSPLRELCGVTAGDLSATPVASQAGTRRSSWD